MCDMTELPIFKRTIEVREVIELQGSGMREVRRDADGQFKPESCRFIAYSPLFCKCVHCDFVAKVEDMLYPHV